VTAAYSSDCWCAGALLTAARRPAPQARLNRMVGQPSGFIETLPKAVRDRIEYLRTLQEKHDDLEDKYNEELRALEAKYEALYGALRATLPAHMTAPASACAPAHSQRAQTGSRHACTLPQLAGMAARAPPPGLRSLSSGIAPVGVCAAATATPSAAPPLRLCTCACRAPSTLHSRTDAVELLCARDRRCVSPGSPCAGRLAEACCRPTVLRRCFLSRHPLRRKSREMQRPLGVT